MKKLLLPLLTLLLISTLGSHAGEPVYLGNLSKNPLDFNSTSNPLGPYGSNLSQTSINNPLSPYGSAISQTSANNPMAQSAPVIISTDGVPAIFSCE